jgi:type I restriction enzyme S subunit
MNDWTSPVDIRPDHLEIVQDILRECLPAGFMVWVFGSRANWTTKDSSDLDLAVEGAGRLDNKAMVGLEVAFEESDLPYTVDMVDLNAVSPEFKRIVEVQRAPMPSADGQETVNRGWHKLTLGDVAHIVMGQSPLGETVSNNQGIALLNGPTEFGSHHPTPVQFTTDPRKFAEPGDILFCVRGSTTGRMNWADQEYAIGRGIAAIRHREESMLQPLVRGVIEIELPELLAQATGSTFPNVSASQLAEIPYPNLDKSEQRAIFQDWFVDFGPVRAKLEGREPYLPPELWGLFPDQLVDSELGEIPEGWEIRRIEDISERVAMGPFGSSIKVSTFVDSGIPVISGQHLTGTLLEDGDYRFITEGHADKLANANVRRGDIVFTHAGSIGQAAYIPETSQYDRYVISQRQFYMRCDTSKISPLFVVHFFKTQEGQHQLLANTSSTGVPSIARPVTYLRSISLCLPPKALWSIFHSAVRGFYLNVGRNDNEGRTIVAQRDALLPKLVSGEVRIKNV